MIDLGLPHLDLKGNQPDYSCAERKRRREVGAQVEKRQSVGHTGGANNTHYL